MDTRGSDHGPTWIMAQWRSHGAWTAPWCVCVRSWPLSTTDRARHHHNELPHHRISARIHPHLPRLHHADRMGVAPNQPRLCHPVWVHHLNDAASSTPRSNEPHPARRRKRHPRSTRPPGPMGHLTPTVPRHRHHTHHSKFRTRPHTGPPHPQRPPHPPNSPPRPTQTTSCLSHRHPPQRVSHTRRCTLPCPPPTHANSNEKQPSWSFSSSPPQP